MTTLHVRISGMTCDHCAIKAQQAIESLPGIKADVCFDDGLATIESSCYLDEKSVLARLHNVGYTARTVDQNGAPIDTETPLHVAIIGSGSAAFAAATKLVEQGARVSIIEAGEVVGGTCVNVGCVPSKIMIRAAGVAHNQSQHNFSGITQNRPNIDRKQMLTQQQDRVKELRYAKYEKILEHNSNISLIHGFAQFKNEFSLLITHEDGNETTLEADRILIASGASAVIPDIPGLAQTPWWTSTEALQTETLPEHLIVLGGSVIALEMAQAFRHLGCAVTLIARSSLLSKEEHQLGKEIKSIFEGENINVITHVVPESVEHDGKNFIVFINGQPLQADALLLATGRQANTAQLNLKKAGIKADKTGAIKIDGHMRTSASTVYAAGDCTSQPQFVYVAAAAGTRAAVNMTGGSSELDLSVLPRVIFTSPQVASIGLSEQQANLRGIDNDSRTLTLDNIPRALANFDTRGFIKLVVEKNSGRIIGCHVISENAGEIIQSAALAIRNQMTVKELANQLFPYLTMVEGLKLCAQTFFKDVSELSCCAG